MSCRDRIGELRKLRKVGAGYGIQFKEEAESSSDSDDDDRGKRKEEQEEKARETYEVLEQCNLVHSYILEISEYNMALAQLQAKILESTSTDPSAKQSMEEIVSQVKKRGKVCQVTLKQLEMDIHHIKQDIERGVGSCAVWKLKKTQHATLSQRFLDTMFRFSNTQEKFKKSCEFRVQRQMRMATGRDITADEAEEMVEKGETALNTQAMAQLHHEAQTKKVLRDVEQRSKELEELEANIKELHDLFQEAAFMIERHGNLLNSIEHHVINTLEYVSKAKQHISRATGYKETVSRRRLYCIITIVTLVGIVIFVIIIFFTIHFGQKDPPAEIADVTNTTVTTTAKPSLL